LIPWLSQAGQGSIP
jgi:hypothetical protein